MHKLTNEEIEHLIAIDEWSPSFVEIGRELIDLRFQRDEAIKLARHMGQTVSDASPWFQQVIPVGMIKENKDLKARIKELQEFEWMYKDLCK